MFHGALRCENAVDDPIVDDPQGSAGQVDLLPAHARLDGNQLGNTLDQEACDRRDVFVFRAEAGNREAEVEVPARLLPVADLSEATPDLDRPIRPALHEYGEHTRREFLQGAVQVFVGGIKVGGSEKGNGIASIKTKLSSDMTLKQYLSGNK